MIVYTVKQRNTWQQRNSLYVRSNNENELYGNIVVDAVARWMGRGGGNRLTFHWEYHNENTLTSSLPLSSPTYSMVMNKTKTNLLHSPLHSILANVKYCRQCGVIHYWEIVLPLAATKEVGTPFHCSVKGWHFKWVEWTIQQKTIIQEENRLQTIDMCWSRDIKVMVWFNQILRVLFVSIKNLV